MAREILRHISLYLTRADLKRLRLVYRTLDWDARYLLFRTIDVSCLTLDRLRNICNHPGISKEVKELHWHEMDFKNVQTRSTVRERPLPFTTSPYTGFMRR